MKKFFEILLVIILIPFIIIGLIYFLIYSLFEMLVVKHTSYFKKNKLRIRDEYYYGILNDPIFKIKNIICKYNLEYKVVSIDDEEKGILVINKNNECIYVFIRMKNIYINNQKLFYQEATDEGIRVDVDAYLESIRSNEYNFEKSKLLIMKEFISREDFEIIKNDPKILCVKEVNKKILNI